jgi:CheY-like chemotaxis protein
MTSHGSVVERGAAINRSVSVLFVEEKPEDCADYVAAVLAKGWRAEVVPSADRALARIKLGPPDVVITDADAGGEAEGFGLAHRVKTDPATRHVPVIVLTALPFVDWPEAMGASRCGVCVSRPCGPDAVIVALSSALAISAILARRRALRDAGVGPKGTTALWGARGDGRT